MNQLLDTTELEAAALDDQMVEQLGATSATLGEAVDGIATDETDRKLHPGKNAWHETTRRILACVPLLRVRVSPVLALARS
ncbi:hypothetical protein [Natrinema saccharevitans]|nr:hypothetical protein [Natrinema saccharevitans]